MTKSPIRKDAAGQFAPSEADGKNNGLASATPRSVRGHDDATLENSGDKTAPKPGFDIRNRDKREK